VLVKSEADFPTAVSGTITLDENVLYEINGNITVTNSIDLNNATIIGHDIGEDIIAIIMCWLKAKQISQQQLVVLSL